MHTAHLSESNVDFAYLDSGAPAPESADYTTLVCIHGNTYHAQAFQRVLPLAPQHNLRLIALNRRDYVGSTPYNNAELVSLFSSDESRHRQFLYDRGLEIAHFLLWVAHELKIPQVRNSGKAGGISLLGWSLGNITSIAFLANLARFPSEVTQELERYLRHYFIYEAVYQFLGIPSPKGAYHPLWDDEVAMEKKPSVIDAWFTSYFTHPYFSCPPEKRIRDLSSLQLRTPANPVKPPTSSNRTSEEYASIADTSPVMRSEIAFYFHVREATLYDQYKAALTYPSDAVSKKNSIYNKLPAPSLPLPNLKVTVVDATQTVWNIIWASWAIEKDVRRWNEEGKVVVRPIEFITIEDVNHYALWDRPEVFMEALASCLK